MLLLCLSRRSVVRSLNTSELAVINSRPAYGAGTSWLSVGYGPSASVSCRSDGYSNPFRDRIPMGEQVPTAGRRLEPILFFRLRLFFLWEANLPRPLTWTLVGKQHRYSMPLQKYYKKQSTTVKCFRFCAFLLRL